MPDQSSGTPSRAPIVGGIVSIALLIAGAVTAVEPATQAAEGEVLVAYQDSGGVWTICRGHTGPEVHKGLVATHEQCHAWYRADMTKAMTASIAVTPALKQNKLALEAAGDFVLNAGPGWWRPSPMAAHFSKLEWQQGCDAFPGYITLYRAPKPVANRQCRRNAKGTLYCELPGLVTRRLKEQAICTGRAA